MSKKNALLPKPKPLPVMINCDIEVKNKKWLKHLSIVNFIEKSINDIVSYSLLKKYLKDNNFLQVNISLVSNTQMQKINFRYRGKNKPTNVLSFANLDEKEIKELGIKKIINNLNHLVLGDIVLALETIEQEAINMKKEFNNHLIHLLVHAILHLIGYDHEKEPEAIEMQSYEIKILKKFKILNPY